MKYKQVLFRKSSGITLGFSILKIILVFSFFLMISCENQPPVLPLDQLLIKDSTLVVQIDSVISVPHNYDLESAYYLYAGNYDSIESSIFMKFEDFGSVPDTVDFQIRKLELWLYFDDNYFSVNKNSTQPSEDEEVLLEDEIFGYLRIGLINDQYIDWNQENADSNLLNLTSDQLVKRKYDPQTSHEWMNFTIPVSVLENWVSDSLSNQGLRIDVLPFGCELMQKINARNTSYSPYLKLEYFSRSDTTEIHYLYLYPTDDISIPKDKRSENDNRPSVSAYGKKSLGIRIPWDLDKDNYYIHKAYLHVFQDTLLNRFYNGIFEFRLIYYDQDSSRYFLSSDNYTSSNTGSEIRLDITSYIRNRTLNEFPDEYIYMEADEYSDLFSKFYILESDSLKPYLEVLMIDENP